MAYIQKGTERIFYHKLIILEESSSKVLCFSFSLDFLLQQLVQRNPGCERCSLEICLFAQLISLHPFLIVFDITHSMSHPSLSSQNNFTYVKKHRVTGISVHRGRTPGLLLTDCSHTRGTKIQMFAWVCLIIRKNKTLFSSDSSGRFIGYRGLSCRRGTSVNALIFFSLLHYPGVSIFSPLRNPQRLILCGLLIARHLPEMDAARSCVREREQMPLGNYKSHRSTRTR